MAEVILNSNLAERKWLVNDYYRGYVRASGFDRFMGDGSDSIIRIFNESKTDGGKDIIVPLVGAIRNEGVTGSQVLKGNEVDLEQFVDVVRCQWRRNAVKVPKSTSYRSNLDILKIAGPELRSWAARFVLKRGIINNMNGIVIPGAVDAEGFAAADTVTTYAAASAGQRNAYLQNNRDRMLFGALEANSSSGVFATSLANVDNTDDRMSTAILDTARAKAAETADMDAVGPAITPYMTEDGEEWYVVFVQRRQMRDLRRDPVMIQANRDAMERGRDNPLFRNGDLLWNGMIIKEVADLPVIPGAGAAGVDVAQATLTGQSAIAVAWGQRPRMISDRDEDYQFRPATAIEELIGIKKTSFAGKMYGSMPIFTAAAPNA